MQHTNSFISFVAGAATVSVPTPLHEVNLTNHILVDSCLFLIKALCGGLISIGGGKLFIALEKWVKSYRNKKSNKNSNKRNNNLATTETNE